MHFKRTLGCLLLMFIRTQLLEGHEEQENQTETTKKKQFVHLHLKGGDNDIKESFKNMSLSLAELSSNQKQLLDSFTNAVNLNTQIIELLVQKAKQPTCDIQYDEHFNCAKDCCFTLDLPEDCSEAFAEKKAKNGVYAFNLNKRGLRPFGAFCERYEGKFWTIIQRRQDGYVSFERNWKDYRNGFGDLKGDYWLGLDRIHAMTSKKNYELWIEMEAFDGEKSFARYAEFSVAHENDGYKLKVKGYSGNAENRFEGNDGDKFSTFDVDNDIWSKSCAHDEKGGWWYIRCGYSNLNGEHENVKHESSIYWDWGNIKPLKYVHMALHPA